MAHWCEERTDRHAWPFAIAPSNDAR